MIAEDVLERLRQMSNPERLALIEAARRLIDEDSRSHQMIGCEDDPILRVAGCLSGEPLTAEEIEEELYSYGSA
jgi:hypothetical protein